MSLFSPSGHINVQQFPATQSLLDSATRICTPPAVPPSPLHKMPPLQKSQALTCIPQDPPLTCIPQDLPLTHDLDLSLHKRPALKSLVHSAPQKLGVPGTAKEGRASGKHVIVLHSFLISIFPQNIGSQILPPKILAKCKVPMYKTEEEQPFSESPLAENLIPKAPSHKRQKVNVAAMPTRRSQRAVSKQPLTADSI